MVILNMDFKSNYLTMKKLIFLFSLFMLLLINSCEPSQKLSQKEYPCDNVHTQRIGAICKDGTRSNATGSGACSGHGGVNYWLCN